MSKKTWKIDPSHSEIQFKVKHMIISTVTGEFDKFDAEAVTEEENLENAQITFTAEAASVNTGNEQRDGHLKSDDFFNAEKFPAITFKSTSFTKKSGNEYLLKGDLTIRDITKPIELVVEHGGTVKDPWGNNRAGFIVTGKINRKEYGLKWHALLETGGAVVSDDVNINVAVEFVHQ
jgi:polyisoprenoid-binding protein YceI